jgi:hypothetical protein
MMDAWPHRATREPADGHGTRVGQQPEQGVRHERGLVSHIAPPPTTHKHIPPAGLEPAIFGLEVRRLIH